MMPQGATPKARPFFWSKCLVGLLLSPCIGFLIGIIVFDATMPAIKASVTVPSVAGGEALGRALLRNQIQEAEMQHIWKIKFWMWLAIALAAVCSLVWVQYVISKRRRQLKNAEPSVREEFERNVKAQEPRQWVLGLVYFVKSLTKPEGQQRLVRALVDFFSFKFLLMEYLAPLVYVLALIYFTAKGIDVAAEGAVYWKLGGLFKGMGYFIIEAIVFRLGLEYFMVPFSIQGLLRTIRTRLTNG